RAASQVDRTRSVLDGREPGRGDERDHCCSHCCSTCAKYHGLCAASPCDSGIVSVPGRRKASGKIGAGPLVATSSSSALRLSLRGTGVMGIPSHAGGGKTIDDSYAVSSALPFDSLTAWPPLRFWFP